MSLPDRQKLTALSARISTWRRPLLISHMKPDGDALGALVALRSFLTAGGVRATALLFDPIPEQYAVFQRFDAMSRLCTGERSSADTGTGQRRPTLVPFHATELDSHDAVILVDTCAASQVEPLGDWIRTSRLPKLAIDHHETRDDLADDYLVDESAAATCVILYEWARAAGWPLAPDAREALFIGIATDTGWFRFSNTDQRAFFAAADLVACGVRPADLYGAIFLRETPARVRVLAAALNSLALYAGQRIAIMLLPREAFGHTGANEADTENIVNEPLRIASVAVSVLLTEAEGGVIRVSLRSKPPSRTAADRIPDVNVAEVAQAIGGGGHARAAGARISTTLADARDRILDHLSRRLGSA